MRKVAPVRTGLDAKNTRGELLRKKDRFAELGPVRWRGLQRVADQLWFLELGGVLSDAEANAWRLVRDQIIKPIGRVSLLEFPSARAFNRLASEQGACLRLDPSARPTVGAADPVLGSVLGILWRDVFPDERRLKACKLCGRWFVDTTKNRQKSFCSPSCANRLWTQAYRRESKRRHRRARGRPLG
jgi:hypothetical protein